MKKQIVLFFATLSLLISCSKEVEIIKPPFIVAFEETSAKLLSFSNEEEVKLLYSETATEQGTIRIKIDAKNASYGVDFTTIPEAVNNEISLPIAINETANSFKILQLNNSFTSNMEIKFTIANVELSNASIQGNTTYLLNDDAFFGGSFSPTIGGANEPNQVYIDLSSNKETVVKRDKWDLGFYNGNKFRVTINGSLYMAVKALNTTDMNSVTSANVASLQQEVAVGTFQASNVNYIDHPNGNIEETAIAEIAVNETQNPVYLVNLGAEVGTAQANVGSTVVAGNPRGWKKIRILRSGEGYKLQYADLDATTFKEIEIQKNTAYNLTFFSFNTQSIVDIEPRKENWDICFSVFTNTISGAGSYGFSDFVFHNRKGGVKSYLIENGTIPFSDFSKNNIDESLLVENQTVIGSSWRNVFRKTVYDSKYYILKDADGNYYKLKFLALVNEQGIRGHSKFEFELLK